jgi:hypothetical protein
MINCKTFDGGYWLYENPINYNLNKINKILNRVNKGFMGYNRIKEKVL